MFSDLAGQTILQKLVRSLGRLDVDEGRHVRPFVLRQLTHVGVVLHVPVLGIRIRAYTRSAPT